MTTSSDGEATVRLRRTVRLGVGGEAMLEQLRAPSTALDALPGTARISAPRAGIGVGDGRTAGFRLLSQAGAEDGELFWRLVDASSQQPLGTLRVRLLGDDQHTRGEVSAEADEGGRLDRVAASAAVAFVCQVLLNLEAAAVGSLPAPTRPAARATEMASRRLTGAGRSRAARIAAGVLTGIILGVLAGRLIQRRPGRHGRPARHP